MKLFNADECIFLDYVTLVVSAFSGGSVVKNLPADSEDAGDTSRSLG